ncbi:MAG: IPT/TIG domain-containing protein [Actinomycetota bacterium]|nr:IPT/TIG domain-containing protein [Actinomycetota bacterium]
MSPLAVGGGILAVLVGALVVGGLLRIRTQSVGYERAVDRSYAAQARLFVEESNRQGEELRTLLAGAPHDDRTALEESLDTLVRSTSSLAIEAATAASPAPSGDAGADVAAAMAERATAARDLRTAVDRLLGMAPLPVVGAPGPSATAWTPPPLSAAGAAAVLEKVGTLLERSDREYAAGRRALRRAPGGARLPFSAWTHWTKVWTPSGARALVGALTSSRTLAAIDDVELVVHALALTPAPVPAAGAGRRGETLLPPTGHLRIAAVVANDGNVAERGIVLRASVARAGKVVRLRRSRRIALTAHRSVSVTLPEVPVVPGDRYTVVVSVDPPRPDVPGAVTSDTIELHVAPPGPPTVTQLLPTTGTRQGGTDVTILGTGFTWVRRVSFGTAAAHFKVVSTTQITAVAPPGAGTVTVEVTNPGGSSGPTPAGRFRYRSS